MAEKHGLEFAAFSHDWIIQLRDKAGCMSGLHFVRVLRCAEFGQWTVEGYCRILHLKMLAIV